MSTNHVFTFQVQFLFHNCILAEKYTLQTAPTSAQNPSLGNTQTSGEQNRHLKVKVRDFNDEYQGSSSEFLHIPHKVIMYVSLFLHVGTVFPNPEEPANTCGTVLAW